MENKSYKSVKVSVKGHDLFYNVANSASLSNLNHLVHVLMELPSAEISDTPYDKSYPKDQIHMIDRHLASALNDAQILDLFREKGYIQSHIRDLVRDNQLWERIVVEIEDSKINDCAFFEKIGEIYSSRGSGGVILKDIRVFSTHHSGEAIVFEVKVTIYNDDEDRSENTQDIEVTIRAPAHLFSNFNDEEFDAWIDSCKNILENGEKHNMARDIEKLRNSNPELFDQVLAKMPA